MKGIRLFRSGVLAVSLLTASPAVADAPGLGALRGQVVDAATGEPLSFAKVSVVKNGMVVGSVQSDYNGVYFFEALRPGAAEVFASTGNYLSRQQRGILILPNRLTRFDIKLEKHQAHSCSISGMVTDSKTQTPIPYASVSIFKADSLITTVVTDMNGKYLISSLHPGLYNLKVYYPLNVFFANHSMVLVKNILLESGRNIHYNITARPALFPDDAVMIDAGAFVYMGSVRFRNSDNPELRKISLEPSGTPASESGEELFSSGINIDRQYLGYPNRNLRLHPKSHYQLTHNDK